MEYDYIRNYIKDDLKAVGFDVQWWAFVDTAVTMYSIKGYDFLSISATVSFTRRAWHSVVVGRSGGFVSAQ